MRAFARHAIVVCGVLGAAKGMPPDDLPGAPHALTFALKLISLGALATAVLIERSDGVSRYWTTFLPPVVFIFFSAAGGVAQQARLPVMVASAALAVWGARRSSDEDGPQAATLSPWSGALLVTATCLCIAYVVVGTTATGSTDNDPAYYYGVARHIILSHRYEEPIVWHFLVKPPHLLHRPFDYWSGLASISLLPFFWLFGTTHRVAGAAMGLVSGLSVIAFAYLIGVAAPLRSRVVQVVSLLLFAFSPALMRFRFDVETIPFVHLWMILSLIALARRCPEWAVVFAFVMFWSRSEDVVLAALISAVALIVAAGESAPRRRIGQTLLSGAICGGVYVLYHLWMFGTPLPAGTAVGSGLTDYMALYRWTDVPPATWTLKERLLPEYLAGRARVALSNLQELTYFVNYPVWLALLLVRGWCWPRDRSNVEGISWLLLLGGALAISLANPTMFAWQRSLHALLPVFVLAGAYGAEAIFEALAHVPRFRFPPAAPAWLVRHLPAFLLAVVMIRPLKMSLEPGAPLAFGADMATLDATLSGGITMSPRPWSVIAETRSPSIYVPENGEAAIDGALRRYQVRWLLLVGDECLGESQAICRGLMSGTRDKIGGATLTKRVTRGDLTLFDVTL